MLRVAMWAALLAGAVPMPAGRSLLGQYGRWGAFRDAAPARCYAIAQPLDRPEGAAFLTVASSPDGRVRSQLRVRLSHEATAADAAGVPLAVAGREARPVDRRGERRIVALLRGGGVLEIRARDGRGRRFRDRYPLGGAASAIDAMRLACLAP